MRQTRDANYQDLDKDDLIALIIKQSEQIRLLSVQIVELKDQLAKNSRNSGKPPSSDGLKKPKPKSLREKGQRKTGGQNGHPGKTLCLVEIADEVVVEHCPHCQCDLQAQAVERMERRQMFDLPPQRLRVTEHQAQVKRCTGCGELVKAHFPAGVETSVQYGAGLKAQIVYLSSYQLLPIARLVELIDDVYGQRLSADTVLGMCEDVSVAVQPSLTIVKDALLQADVAHCDETGLRVGAKTQWLHVFSTPTLTFYAVHAKRGQDALRSIGLVAQFTGRLMHDAFVSYFVFDQCQHSLCHAHILRELTFLFEQHGQGWANDLKTLLVTMKKAVAEARALQQFSLDPNLRHQLVARYHQLLQQAWQDNPPLPPARVAKRGRVKKSAAQNLLQRLETHHEAVLAFLHDFRVPFDNNLAERDLRMMKVKQKISGSFRTQTGANIFATLRS